MKIETLACVIDFVKLKERLKQFYGVEALISATRTSENRLIINVYLENIFADKDISVFMKFNVDEESNDLLKFSANDDALKDDSTEIDMIKAEIENHIVNSIKSYNTDIANGNDTLNAEIEEFHSLIKTFNFKSDPYQLIIVEDLLKLYVPKMHPHQKGRYFTIAKISEHSYDELIFIVNTQIHAINFYDELLCREDLFDVRFKLSRNRRSTLDVILKDDLTANERVRVRMIDQDFIEVTCSIHYVTSNSEYVEISDKNSQIVYKVSSNDDYDKRDYLIETATSQRCPLKDFSKTLSDVKFRLKDRIIRITPVTD